MLAYDKDPITGIVRHLDDQCIGCQYCVAGCPFDIPRFDPASKKVYKCTLCVDRVTSGLEPACVVVCPTEALLVGDMNDPEYQPKTDFELGIIEVGGDL